MYQIAAGVILGLFGFWAIVFCVSFVVMAVRDRRWEREWNRNWDRNHPA